MSIDSSSSPRRSARRSSAHAVDETIRARYDEVRHATTRLAAPLSAEDCALQSMPDASPVKWHLGHTTWFFETFVLERFEPAFSAHEASFRVLFNSYYDAVGPKHPRPERGLLSRPSLADVLAYRDAIDARMHRMLGRVGDEPELAFLVELGLHHEQQHQELIVTDVKHLFSANPLEPAYRKPVPRLHSVRSAAVHWHAYAEGIVLVGDAGAGFAFDNERPRHKSWIAAFELASHPVTNREYMAFIADGGYRRPELWLSLGWDAVKTRGWEAPLYWRREHDRDGWTTFTLHGRAPVEADAPVTHVSFFEAEAYARWAGARLPTEQEWETAAAAASIDGHFADDGRFDPLPARPDDDRAAPAQLFGDVWEWTRSEYGPYPGFRTAPGAVGEYNGKFMCGQYVLRGGSCATPRSHIRATYRNFFPPDARWQFSGIRLAR